jgi:hypothetical protein
MDSMSFTQTKCGLRGLSGAQPTDPLRKFTELYPVELYAWARTEVPATAEAVLLFYLAGMASAQLGRLRRSKKI